MLLGSPILFFVLLSAPSAPTPDAAGLIPLKIDRSPPIFDRGYDRKLRRDPNIEQPDRRPKPLMVPADTINIAYEMPVTISDKDPIIGHPGLITDGNNVGADGEWLEMSQGLQWVQIDLMESCPIDAIALWHFCANDCVFHDVVIQACDRPDFARDVKTLFNNDSDNSAHLGKGTDREYLEDETGKVIVVKNTRARYVRLYSRGSTLDDLNHYVEVMVFGEGGPAQKAFRALRKNRHANTAAFLQFLESREPGSIRRKGKDIVAITAALEEARDLSLLSAIPTLAELTILPGGDWRGWGNSGFGLPSVRKLDIRDEQAVYFILNRTLSNVESLSLGVRSAEIVELVGALPKLKQLKTLHVMLLPIDEIDATFLRKLTMLRSLSLSGSDAGDQLVHEIKTLTNLEHLDLSNTKITSGVMWDVKPLKLLRSLNLSNTKVGDAILLDLGDFPSLTSIDLSDTLVTPGAVDAARKRFPRLQIRSDQPKKKRGDAGATR